MRHVFIVNPVSGKEDAGRSMIPRIQAAAGRCGVDHEVLQTQYAKHATELVAAIAGSYKGPVRFYAVGGDGTLNEVLNGAHGFENAEVACVPCGSGNDFVRNYGEASQFLDLDAQIQGSAITIDLIETDGGVCAAITSTGLDAEVAYNIPKYRRIPGMGGTMAYNISIVEKLLRPLGKTLRLELDGVPMEGKYLIATVCNGRTYGGGYCAAPYAKLDDGLLEVILVKKVSRFTIAGIIGAYKNGRHFDGAGQILPKYQNLIFHYTAREVTITPTGSEPFILNVDGECGPAPRLYARVMPGAARFVLPAGLQK